MLKKRYEVADEDLYSLKIGVIWRYFKGESFAFWMVCGYLFFEYVRPQSIYPAINFLPWTQLVIIGAVLGTFSDKTIKWVSSPINKLLIILFLVILFSSIFAYFPKISFDNLEKYYLWIIIYFIIINVINTKKRFFIFICIFLIASFKLSLSLSITWARRGFSFTDWGLMGPPGFFQNSGELAIQMLVYWPIAWAFVLVVKPYIRKPMYYFLTLMPITAILVILGASSRGAQLALICQLLVMNYRYFLKPKVLVAMAISFILIWNFLPQEQKERFESMGDDSTSRQRLLYWENGVEMILDNPLLGVGFFNFAPYFERFYPEDVIFGRAQLPHNIFVQVGTDAGIIGLVIFVSLLLVTFRKCRKFANDKGGKNNNIVGNCANLSLLGFVVSGQFVTVTYYPFLWIHLSLVVALLNSEKRNINK